MDKMFFIPRDAIKRNLAPGRGSCIASNLITVEGNNVGFMYREEPDNSIDSGWRFFAGSESQEFVDDVNNLGLYDVNTIANYDTDIIPLLDSPFGCAFEKEPGSREFAATEFPSDPDLAEG